MNQLRRLADRLLVHGAAILLVALSCLVPTPLVLLCAGAAEPSQAEKPSDEEIFGKYAIGPKTPTPLDQAVEALNQKLKTQVLESLRGPVNTDRAKAALAPLTAEEIGVSVRNWHRDVKPVADTVYRIYEQIVAGNLLPPHSLLTVDEQWVRRGDREHHVFRILLDVTTGKNQGYTYVIRERDLDGKSWPAPRRGYRWLTPPRPNKANQDWLGWIDRSGKVTFDQANSDTLVVLVNRPHENVSLQVVAFDEDHKRYDLDCRSLGCYAKFISDQFHLNPAELPRNKVAYLGIEGVTREDLSRLSETAKVSPGQQVDLLPLPEVGVAYEFSLNLAGKPIDSRQLRGKVILVDLWGSWCAPCLKKMPELKELYSKWHDKGLEIIGISFDEDPEEAQAVIDRLKLPWPSANLPPRETEVRKLWRGRDQITHLPTVLIIDAQGVLRFELVGNSGKIEEKIEGLLSGTARTTDEAQGTK